MGRGNVVGEDGALERPSGGRADAFRGYAAADEERG